MADHPKTFRSCGDIFTAALTEFMANQGPSNAQAVIDKAWDCYRAGIYDDRDYAAILFMVAAWFRNRQRSGDTMRPWPGETA